MIQNLAQLTNFIKKYQLYNNIQHKKSLKTSQTHTIPSSNSNSTPHSPPYILFFIHIRFHLNAKKFFLYIFFLFHLKQFHFLKKRQRWKKNCEKAQKLMLLHGETHKKSKINTKVTYHQWWAAVDFYIHFLYGIEKKKLYTDAKLYFMLDTFAGIVCICIQYMWTNECYRWLSIEKCSF